MSHEIRIEALTPWIEVLCEAGDARAQDRLLLEGVLALGLASAAAIWRRGDDGAWRQHVARGPIELLPRAAEVEAVASRTLRADVLPARSVHVSGAVALALGGLSRDHDERDVGSDDDVLDVAEALLATYAAVSAGTTLPSQASHGDTWPAPLPAKGKPQGTTDPGAEEERRMQHDLRNVMTSLRATEDLLSRFAEGLTSEESSRFKAAVERECARAGELIAQGLSAEGRPRAEHLHSAPPSEADRSKPTCRVAEVVEHVLEAEHAAFLTAGIRVERLIEPAVIARTCALSPDRLARLVQNLLVNARHALQQHAAPRASGPTPIGTVWVTLASQDSDGAQALVLVVEDDGPGIDEQELERVFEAGVTTKASSSGRGLSIVREIASEAGGGARAEVRVLGGARVRIVLPTGGADVRPHQSDP